MQAFDDYNRKHSELLRAYREKTWHDRMEETPRVDVGIFRGLMWAAVLTVLAAAMVYVAVHLVKGWL